ncbi:hypothetical protein STSP2_01743 [Anaerohalosphaera lusitana]|uniref:Porin n=1 Tax=Anaerohalosphaera lusitana TaxID=1936003 RepID=A0A1U9NL73_9BACT|nr:putative porin [Anaerohalosphaera lusitana]AQT68575.1 hypothetical protein STSP2_01743 [Anaerohalosphaera lusitana]
MRKLFLCVVIAVFCGEYARGEQSVEDRLARLEALLQAQQEQIQTQQAEIESLKKELKSSQGGQDDVERADQEDLQLPVQDGAAIGQREIDEMVDKALAEREKDGTPEWLERIKLKGDFRFRHEHIDDEVADRDRDRTRLRFRIGADAKVNDEVDVGFRLASGSDAPTSTNQSFDNSFTSKDFFLDRAYVDYHPAALEGVNIYGGKMPNPYYFPGNSDLMFDTDVNPEGAALTVKNTLADNTEMFGSAGVFYVEERPEDAESSLWAAQAGMKRELFADTSLTAGLGYFDYGNAKGFQAFESSYTGSRLGNTLVNDRYDMDYDIFQMFGQLGWDAGGVPMVVFADYMKNTDATVSGDTAYLFGTGLGKRSKPGTWDVFYNYRRIESDAVIAAFTDANFGGGRTGSKGHKVNFNYQVSKNWVFATTYIWGDFVGSGKDYRDLYFDMKFKF